MSDYKDIKPTGGWSDPAVVPATLDELGNALREMMDAPVSLQPSPPYILPLSVFRDLEARAKTNGTTVEIELYEVLKPGLAALAKELGLV